MTTGPIPNKGSVPLPQHFLISPAARSLSIAQVLRSSDAEAFDTFKRIRFAANDGEPFCPHCGVAKVYTLAETPIRWKCEGGRRGAGHVATFAELACPGRPSWATEVGFGVVKPMTTSRAAGSIRMIAIGFHHSSIPHVTR